MTRPVSRPALGGLLLTANAIRPLSSASPLALPSFFAGWLTDELAPFHLLAALAAAARGARRGETASTAAHLLSAAGLALLVRQSLMAREQVGQALEQALGPALASAPPQPLPWRAASTPFAFHHPEVVRVADLDYAGDGAPRHRLDVYHPRTSGAGRPVLVQIHGGGWVTGRKDQQGRPLMNRLAAHGWVCVAPNYPLSPRATWPEHLVAVKRALAWTHAHAGEFGGDPAFVAITGGSAGGHLAALAALTMGDPRYQPGFEQADTTVSACVPCYGVYDLADDLATRAGRLRLERFLARAVFKAPAGTARELARSASPLRLAHAQAPPFFVIHGSRDSLVNVAEARELVRRLRAVSRQPVAYAELSGAQHGFDIFTGLRGAYVLAGVERFLDWARQEAAAVNATR